MSFFLQVLCTDAIDSTACVVVGTDSHRVVINCGEGVQRLCVEHKVRLGKITAVLLTDLAPYASLGLPGLALTLADAGNSKVQLVAPRGIKAVLNATRYFMKLPDQLLNISSTTNGTSATVIDNNEIKIEWIDVRVAQRESSCYIGQTPALAGKFDITKAQQFPLLRKDCYGILKSGRSVELSDGTVVRPEQVLGESIPSKFFAVVCRVNPDEHNVAEALFSHTAWERYMGCGQDNGKFLHCMVHLSPAETVRQPAYSAWMASFGPHTTHLLCGAGCSPKGATHSAFWATTVQCRKFHLAVPSLFPPLRTVYDTSVDGSSDSGDCVGTDWAVPGVPADKLVCAVPGMRYTFLPLRGQGVSVSAESGADSAVQAQQLWEAAIAADAEGAIRAAQVHLAEVQASMCDKSANEGGCVNATLESYNLNGAPARLLARTDGCLRFLGTGCAVPSKYRNVSGILLDLPPTATYSSCAVLIDAGEGTWSQMLRLSFEKEINAGSGERPSLQEISHTLAQKLKIVWISHPHADHHLGLVRIILERKSALQGAAGQETVAFTPLVVIAPASVLAFLRDYAVLNPELVGAYIGVSCRQYDPDDDCAQTDCFWSNAALKAQQEQSVGGKHPHDREEAVITVNKDGHQDNSEDAEAEGDAKRARVEPSLHNTLVNALSSTSSTSAVTQLECPTPGPGDASSGGRGWRNFKSVFREVVGEEVRQTRQAAKERADKVLRDCGITALRNVQVVHCGQSYGLYLEFTAGSGASDAPLSTVNNGGGAIKVVYSGDTRPCERLVQAGQGATVLIHEATFENDKAEEAVNKRHSTMAEAAEVGRKMGAFRTVFTHFSQRYPGVPALSTAAPPTDTGSGCVVEGVPPAQGDASTAGCGKQESSAAAKNGEVPPIIAFDFLQLRLRDLLWAPAATALMAAAFPAGSSNSSAAGAKGGGMDVEDD